MARFTVNTNRLEPYSTSRFLVYFDKSTTPVAGVSRVGTLRRTAQVISHNEGGNPLSYKGVGRMTYDPVILERGITHDREFEAWANAVQVLDKGSATTTFQFLRKTLHIALLNERGQQVHWYTLYRCWVSEFQAMPELAGDANAVAIEHLRVENEGWEHDLSVTEPDQSAPA